MPSSVFKSFGCITIWPIVAMVISHFQEVMRYTPHLPTITLNSSLRFSTPRYISRRGAESAEFAEVIPLLEYVFVFTNWVRELSETILVIVFFSV